MKSYKTELDPNNVQRTVLLKHAGTARWAYNWGLQKKIKAYKDTGKSPSAIDLHRELNRLKKAPVEEGGVPWMYEVSKCAPQEALRNLDRAYRNFFRRCKAGAKRKGFPRFKSKKRGIGCFRLSESIRVAEGTIRLPRIGELRLKEHGYLPTETRIISATVSERAGRWFVSVQTEEESSRICGAGILGVDVGVKNLATLSDGTVFENPRALKGAERRLRLLQKAVSRKRRGSNNRRKAVARLARQHYGVSCIRSDSLHKVSSAIAKRCETVVLESLNIAGMVKNRRLAKAISDAAMAELHRQIKYKMEWGGGVVIEADPWFASSKTCSSCGLVKEDLALSDRVYFCEGCGNKIDRDLNASINLENLAVSSTATACRLGSAGRSPVGSGETADWAGTKRRLSVGTDG